MQNVQNFVTLINQSGGLLDLYQILCPDPDSDYLVSVDPDPALKFGSRGMQAPILQFR